MGAEDNILTESRPHPLRQVFPQTKNSLRHDTCVTLKDSVHHKVMLDPRHACWCMHCLHAGWFCWVITALEQSVFTIWTCLERFCSALLDTRIFGNLLHLQAFVPLGKTEDHMSDCVCVLTPEMTPPGVGMQTTNTRDVRNSTSITDVFPFPFP